MDNSGDPLMVRGGARPGGAADRMRELLARTIQDHATDERSTTSALEEIGHRLESLEEAVKEVREREVPRLGAHLEGLAARVDDVIERPPGWAGSLAGQIDLIGGRLAPADELAAVRADVAALAETVGQVLPLLQAVCETVTQTADGLKARDEQFTASAQDLSRLRQSMDAASGRFGRIDKAVAELAQRTAAIDTEVSAIKGRADQGFSTLDTKVSEAAEALTERAGAQETTLTQLTSSVAALGTQAEVLGRQVQIVQDGVGQIDERLGDAEDQLGVIGNTLTVTEGKVTALDQRFGSLDDRLTKSEDKLGERLTAHDKGLAGLGSRVAVLTGKLGPVEGKFAALDTRLMSVDTRTVSVTGKLDALAERFEAVGARIDAVDRKLGELPASPALEEVRNRLGDLTARCAADLDARIAVLGESLAGVARDVSGHPDKDGLDEQVSKIVDAAANEVNARLGTLEEMVLTLAEVLLRPAAARAGVAEAAAPAAPAKSARPKGGGC